MQCTGSACIICLSLLAIQCQHNGALKLNLPSTADVSAQIAVNWRPIETGPGFLKHHAPGKLFKQLPCKHTEKLAVCVMGQLSRLEISSKMANLLQPEALRRTNTGVDVFVVLETDADFYVNSRTIQTSDAACHTDFVTVDDVEKMFSPFYKAGLYVNPSATDPNISNWHHYGSSKQYLNTTKRLQGHFAQWTHLSQCAELIKEHEKITGCQYEQAMKIRDNSIVVEPMVVEAGDKVHVKGCAGWGGIPDKVFYTPRKYLNTTFEGPINLAMKVKNGEKEAVKYIKDVRRPETFLKKVLERDNVPVWEDDTIAIVDGRCQGAAEPDTQGRRKWCLVPGWKDCHQNSSLQYDTCPIGMDMDPPSKPLLERLFDSIGTMVSQIFQLPTQR